MENPKTSWWVVAATVAVAAVLVGMLLVVWMPMD
jgi:hypothetical protein